jgi:hypothetical protein
LNCELKMSYIICSLYLFYDTEEKVWKGISLLYYKQKNNFPRNAWTSMECKEDVLKSLKKSENWFLGTSICLVYDTIFKIYQKLFLKITNFILFQNSFPYPLSQFYSKVLCIILAHIKGILYFRNVLIFFERCESGSIFVRTPQKNISKLPF